MVYDGTKWDTLNREELIIDMIDDKQGLIEERIEIWIEKGKKYPSIMKKFERYLEKKENNMRRAPKPAVAKAMLVKL